MDYTSEPLKNSSNGFGGCLIVIAIPMMIGCIGLISAVPVLGLITLGLCIFGLISIWNGEGSSKNKERTAQKQYEHDMEEYKKKLEIYQEQFQKATMGYSMNLEKWNANVEAFDAQVSEINKKHQEALATLKNALQELYDANIIFPKYRNMVAITTINEYLMSGRCSELEGANGAYNLYEMELRQNIVIGQLSSIISSLEQIKNNQYTLYQEITMANATVNEIVHELRDIKKDTKLNTYFAGVTALAAVSPKVYIGRTF